MGPDHSFRDPLLSLPTHNSLLYWDALLSLPTHNSLLYKEMRVLWLVIMISRLTWQWRCWWTGCRRGSAHTPSVPSSWRRQLRSLRHWRSSGSMSERRRRCCDSSTTSSQKRIVYNLSYSTLQPKRALPPPCNSTILLHRDIWIMYWYLSYKSIETIPATQPFSLCVTTPLINYSLYPRAHRQVAASCWYVHESFHIIYPYVWT